ncbi:alpha/beta fold hydrolase [Polaromonas sp.]|uniref:YheT family hydrolase n=1 Tax=Polaromonas sp. TaxID=1869339 RepID=UPI00286BC2F6|nr:alpha/beta fold hydrolase [Polaromonas sp.]
MNYVAPWWLPGGNLQTIWAALRSERFLGPRPRFRRERWIAPDSDFVDVDWLAEDGAPTLPTSCNALPPEGAGLAWGGPGLRPALTLGTARDALHLRDAGIALSGPVPRPAAYQQPLLVVFHGLEGSSASHYAEAFADVARGRGWACAVPHFRGCSGELNLAPRAYHSGDFTEIDWILRRFARQHGGPVLAVGISLGGNALMRWGAELGAEAGQLVAGMASVCSPLDLAASGWAIGRGFNRQVYTRMFLKTMVPKALQKLDQHPGLFDRDRLLAARDLYEFDNVFTAPVHGFKNADDYWARASAKPHLHRIGIPALALNALNDPFIPAASLPQGADVSRHVTLWQPAQGGHVGFPSPPFPGHVRAMPEAVAAFLAAHL